MAKIAFYTLGCKVNQADTASMENLFLRAGISLSVSSGEADVYIINTCVVTNTGQRKSRQTIHRAIRKNPNALIVVTGCYPQTAAGRSKSNCRCGYDYWQPGPRADCAAGGRTPCAQADRYAGCRA